MTGEMSRTHAVVLGVSFGCLVVSVLVVIFASGTVFGNKGGVGTLMMDQMDHPRLLADSLRDLGVAPEVTAEEVAAIYAAMATRAKEGDVEAARVLVELRKLQVGAGEDGADVGTEGSGG